MQKVIVFIPVRMGSKRFPGKCMYKIGKFPLVCWSYAMAKMSGHITIVTTPDEVVLKDLTDLNIPCVLTSNKPRNGTERCAEALANPVFNGLFKDDDIIIDVQGDMAKFDRDCINEIIRNLTYKNVEYATAFAPLPEGAHFNPNRVKCSVICGSSPDVLFINNFNRNPIQGAENYLHIGIYGYTKKSLERYCQWTPSQRENEMSLEQMRILDNNYRIAGVVSEIPLTIDSPSDIYMVEKEIRRLKCHFPI